MPQVTGHFNPRLQFFKLTRLSISLGAARSNSKHAIKQGKLSPLTRSAQMQMIIVLVVSRRWLADHLIIFPVFRIKMSSRQLQGI